MAAAALVVAAIAVGAPADAAVTADGGVRTCARSRSARTRRLAAHLGGDCGAAGPRAAAKPARPHSATPSPRRRRRGACAPARPPTRGERARPRGVRRVKARRARGAARDGGVHDQRLQQLGRRPAVPREPRARAAPASPKPGALRWPAGASQRLHIGFPAGAAPTRARGSSPTRGTPATRRWPPSAAARGRRGARVDDGRRDRVARRSAGRDAYDVNELASATPGRPARPSRGCFGSCSRAATRAASTSTPTSSSTRILTN